jgi:MFS superfamily sulfate permease-like transporter
MPIAALSGVIFAVSVHTFQWGSFITFYRGPKHDAIVSIVRGVLSVLVFISLVAARD